MLSDHAAQMAEWNQKEFQKLVVINGKNGHPIVKTPGELIENVISLAKSMLDKKLESTINFGTSIINQVILQRFHRLQWIVRTFQLQFFLQNVGM